MDPFIGTIMPVAFNFAPQGWALCAGQAMSIAQNAELYSLIGTTYGGDGVATFALPDLRGKMSDGAAAARQRFQDLNYIIRVEGIFPDNI